MNISSQAKLLWQRFTKSNSLKLQLALTGLLVPASDFLLYQGKYLGISVAIFLLLLGLISFLAQSKHAATPNGKISLLILVAGLIPIVETLNVLTASVGIIATLIAIVYYKRGQKLQNFTALIKQSIRLLVSIPFRIIKDSLRIERLRRQKRKPIASLPLLKNWILPIVLTLGFLWLFTLANPLIAKWIAKIDILYLWEMLGGAFNLKQTIFWVLIFAGCWPLVRPKIKASASLNIQLATRINMGVHTSKGGIDQAQVFRSLLLFNLLFAIQTVLDLVYLWGGGELPAGVSYSQYVHRGTYILLGTTLLAAGFILFVTSKKMRMEKILKIKILLLAWTGQNVILVTSTMMRLELYVEAYALTYLRVSAFIWMFLVMIGLCLIIFRLKQKRTNAWLINASLISLVLTLYVISFANIPYLIAIKNVTTVIDNPHKGLDVAYLSKLGVQAIPAIDMILSQSNWKKNKSYFYRNHNRNPYDLEALRRRLVQQLKHEQNNWRRWSLRSTRLMQYLNTYVTTRIYTPEEPYHLEK